MKFGDGVPRNGCWPGGRCPEAICGLCCGMCPRCGGGGYGPEGGGARPMACGGDIIGLGGGGTICGPGPGGPEGGRMCGGYRFCACCTCRGGIPCLGGGGRFCGVRCWTLPGRGGGGRFVGTCPWMGGVGGAIGAGAFGNGDVIAFTLEPVCNGVRRALDGVTLVGASFHPPLSRLMWPLGGGGRLCAGVLPRMGGGCGTVGCTGATGWPYGPPPYGPGATGAWGWYIGCVGAEGAYILGAGAPPYVGAPYDG